MNTNGTSNKAKNGETTFVLPENWMCYLIYGDVSGMSDRDIQACERWFNQAGKPQMIDASPNTWFTKTHDAGRFGATVRSYTALV